MRMSKHLNLSTWTLSLLFILVTSPCWPSNGYSQSVLSTQQYEGDAIDPVESLTRGYESWWDAAHARRFPAGIFEGWADVMTTKETVQTGFERYYHSSSEPRKRIVNHSSSAIYSTMSFPWSGLNQAIYNANEVLSHINTNEEKVMIDGVDETQMVQALAYLLRGLCKGHLANFFDQANDLTETFGDASVFKPYDEILESALSDLDDVIRISEENDFTTFPFLSNVSMESDQLVLFANSYAAAFVINNGRTGDAYSQDVWQRVANYAVNAYEEDLIMEGFPPAWSQWNQTPWNFNMLRTDLRIINMMDPNHPGKYPLMAVEYGLKMPPAESDDSRLLTDFTYDPDNIYYQFRSSHDNQLLSHYYYSRYNRDLGSDIIVFRKENIDMMLAEALVHLGQKQEAIDIVNDGTRVTRGNLGPLPADATSDEVLEAIYYEVEIELQKTWVGIQFFLNRRRDILQKGTPLHMPVPAEVLLSHDMTVYSFGGVDFADEEGTADGANAWDKDWYPGIYDSFVRNQSFAFDPFGSLTDGFRLWWNGTSDNRLPFAHFDAWADNMTTTNEWQVYYSMGTIEPRNPIDNDMSSDGYSTLSMPWNNLNSALEKANKVITSMVVDSLVAVGGEENTHLALAQAYLLRGLCKGYLATFFDQVWNFTETDTESTFVPYDVMLEAALSDLDEAIRISEEHSFVTNHFLNNITMDNHGLAQFARAHAAKFVISKGRSSSEYSQADWQLVADYADNAWDKDFIFRGTGTRNGDWRHEYQRSSGLDWYWKTDLRIINMMDPDYPSKYPIKAAEASFPLPEATSADARLELDFTYDPQNMHRFVLSRGPQLQSVYYYSRYGDLYRNQGVDDLVVFRKEHRDMMLAEASVHLGDKQQAIDILNSGTRVTRGGLDPLPDTTSCEDVLEAIYYEVEIELQRTWVGYQYFMNRRRDILQAGTPLHLPVPQHILLAMDLPVYTFGGIENIEEPGTADGLHAWNRDWFPGMYDDWYERVINPTALSDDTPVSFSLNQNYPNPFNPVTQIHFSLKVDTHVSIEIYNAMGQRIHVLVNEFRPAGNHQVTFNGTALSSGVYYYKMKTPDYRSVKKMTLIR